MGERTYLNYGRRAASNQPDIEKAGRLPVQRDAEKLIAGDVMQKLAVGPQDRVLDIGCGPGLLAVPIAFAAASVVVIDHPSVVDDLMRRFRLPNIRAIPGEFMSATIGERFDKIVVYSVLHCLESDDAVLAFCRKAIGLLAPGGRCLFGDIPNVDKKRRFLATAAGRAFDTEWKSSAAPTSASKGPALETDHELVTIGDALIQQIFAEARTLGCESYVLPQTPALPFGHTREDMLVCRPQA